MGINIPTERHEPRRTMGSYIWMVYGAPKIGKTTFCNQWTEALFLATEPGTAAMHAAELKITSWQDFVLAVKKLKEEKGKHRWKTLVIDTVDNLYEFLQDAVCTENGWQDLGDAGFGKGYKLARRKLTNASAALRGLGMAVVFVSHERREADVDDNGKRSGETLVTSALPGSARKVLHGAVDFILRAEMDEEGVRRIRTSPFKDGALHIECGSRGELGKPLPETIDLTFDALQQAFRASFGEPGTKPRSKKEKAGTTDKTEKKEND